MSVHLLIYRLHAQYFRWNMYCSDSYCIKVLYMVASKILALQIDRILLKISATGVLLEALCSDK